MTDKNKETENTKIQTEDYPSSQRECLIDGKKYIVTRYFTGDKKLNEIITQLAANRASCEMGL
ncbi:MAG: hypothetical protein K2N47_01900 [Clostridia bacterium]|nr:hypothetical protein [Clostridia bacterium]